MQCWVLSQFNIRVRRWDLFAALICILADLSPPETHLELTLLLPQATIVDNVPSVPVSTKIDIYCIVVKFTTYLILMGYGKLQTVVYFQKTFLYPLLVFIFLWLLLFSVFFSVLQMYL